MLRFLKARERGQIIVIAAVLLPVLLAMTGMAVDVGRYSSDRRSLQNAADAIALAAAQRLCESSCTDYAGAYAAANDILDEYEIDPSDVTISGDGGNTEPHVHVVIERPHDFIFMQVVGIDSRDVGARATANKVSWGGGTGVVPWGVLDNVVSNAGSGDLVTMKYDANNVDNGNFGPIRIDVAHGHGSQDYQEGVSYGSDSHICAESTPNCSTGSCSSGGFPATCAEDADGCVGPECASKPGNMVGGTRDAVDFRMDNTSTSCDDFDEVFSAASTYSDLKFELQDQLAQQAEANGGGRMSAPPVHHGAGGHPTYTPIATNTPPAPTATPAAPTSTPTAGGPTATFTPGSGSTQKYHLNSECNPWIDGPGKCPNDNDGTLCSRRVIIIPVIDSFGNGSEDVTVVRFALMFLEGYDGGKCSGNDCEVRGRFVIADVSANAISGIYDPSAPIQFARLTE